MSPAEEYAICSRCQLADCDDQSPDCALWLSAAARPAIKASSVLRVRDEITLHLWCIEAERSRRVESALRAIRQQQAAA